LSRRSMRVLELPGRPIHGCEGRETLCPRIQTEGRGKRLPSGQQRPYKEREETALLG
jgi:hypothetical protein